jgi:hypothetical protein
MDLVEMMIQRLVITEDQKKRELIHDKDQPPSFGGIP